MATVPTYQQRAGNDRARPTYQSAGSATPTAFGALTGQALSSLGQDVSRFGNEVGEYVIAKNVENIQRYSKDAATEYDTFRRNLMAGDGTEENPGFLSLNGEQAIQARQGVEDALKAKRAEIEGRTDNVYIKDSFKAYADNSDDNTFSTIFTHTSQQREAANKATSEARLLSNLGDAATFWGDNAMFDKLSIATSEEAMQAGSRMGLSPEAQKEYAEQKLSDLIEARITGALEVKPSAAEDLFNNYEKSINGITAASLRSKIDAAKRQEISDANSAEARGHANRIEFQKVNADKLFAKIAKKEFSEVEAASMQADGLITKDQYQDIITWYRQPPGGGNPARANELRYQIRTNQITVEDILRDPELDEGERKELMNVADEAAKNGGLLARKDVQMVFESIRRQVVGDKGMFDSFTPTESARLDGATTDFYNAIANVQGGLVTTEFLNKTKADVVQAWGKEVEQDIQHLPRPAYWKGPTTGSKPEMIASLKQAAIDLQKANLSPEALNREVARLRKYEEKIKLMPEPVAPKVK